MSVLSKRAQTIRDWGLFALAALMPAIAVGWLGLRALAGEEDASRRELAVALQAVAERTARTVQEQVDASEAGLAAASLPDATEGIAPVLRDLAPVFADAVVLGPDRSVLVPAAPKRVAVREVEPPPSHCAELSDAMAQPSTEPADRQRFLRDCQESRTPTGRWLWPIVALRRPADASQDEVTADAVASWVELHAPAMRRTERDATSKEANAARWLPADVRDRVMRALSPAVTRHEAIARTVDQEGVTALAGDASAAGTMVRWRARGSWGVLRPLADGRLVGFVIHAASVESALQSGWPSLPPEYRADLSIEPGAASDEVLVEVASIAPGLALRVGLADPALPARQAARRRTVLVAVGAVTAMLAFALAAVLFLRMRAAKRLSELRTGFVSTVSHELRTPIASVRMLAELLEQDRVEPEEKQEVHTALAREARRLGETVDRLLGFSRMAAGRNVVHRQPDSVSEVLEASIRTFEERFASHAPVERDFPSDLSADIDAGQLQLAVDNLLGNAQKYAPEGIPYRVAAHVEGGQVVVEVSDRGPGIPRRDRKRVFRAFERGDDRLSSAVQGSGLGLALVRYVAEAHGGSAKLVSGRAGTCVRIRFPRRIP